MLTRRQFFLVACAVATGTRLAKRATQSWTVSYAKPLKGWDEAAAELKKYRFIERPPLLYIERGLYEKMKNDFRT